MDEMTDATRPDRQLGRRHRTVAVWCAAVVVCMVGAAYAAVPLYRLLCNLTGFDGTPQRATAPSDVVLDRVVTVRFDANTAPGFPWRFEPLQRTVDVKVGETTLVHYRATNASDKAVTGTSTFNVFPEQAGVFFNKLECFCFKEQVLEPGESLDMPVSFFIDPQMVKDKDAGGITHITLSYTFFPVTPTSGPKPGLAEKPANGAPATPRAVPGDGRAG
jgi:cytochrome c oxidase assembly protein subunit 11